MAGRLRIRVRGAVQGVGFRPFVHRLAARNGLSGYVRNDAEGVLIEVEGATLAAFSRQLRDEAPTLARIDSVETVSIPMQGDHGFAIQASIGGRSGTRALPDAATCEDCLAELFDPASRFHAYPFVTCHQCGPRFTIIRSLPYDRACTSLADFPLCAACAAEYGDPSSRRFHTEAIACPRCGPRLSHSPEVMAEILRQGGIVALKGIGGFHLLCDAGNEAAVVELRRRKRRPDRPFAVMAAGMPAARHIAAPTPAEAALLTLSARPIVLMRERGLLAPSVNPGLRYLGVMLAYAPVHHLLFQALACQVLVATSGNQSGEPLIADDDQACVALASIADLIVTHDRPIVQRADDSLMAVIGGAPVFLRRSRGFVPEPIDLGADGPTVLAVGGHLKGSITVTRGREAFISQHVGDLDNAATVRFHAEAARHLLALLDVKPEAVACDLHPDYRSTRFAEASGLPVIRIQHHAAHVAAVAAEHRLAGPLLGVALDGHGMGPHGEAWGGELLRLEGCRWQRIGHLAPLPLPGGDRAAREPWRMGVGALAVLGRLQDVGQLFPDIALAPPLARMLAGEATIATTSSLGRLFDAAAALLRVRMHQSYEGQAAMELEALVAMPTCHPGGYAIRDTVLDFTPLLSALTACAPAEGAALLHGTLIAGLADWIARSAVSLGLRIIVLGGGCLANRVLAEGLVAALAARDLQAFLPREAPANDGGLSLGQAALARHHLVA